VNQEHRDNCSDKFAEQKSGTSAGWIRANASLSDRTSVTAGFANDVEDANQ